MKLSPQGLKLLLPAALCALSLAPAANAAPRPMLDDSLVEPWPGQKVTILLPLQLGPGWNASGADPELGRLLLPLAEQQLEQALSATGKMSVTQPHRFNPLLRRAVLEGRITEDDISQYASSPTLEAARVLLSKLQFAQPPLIAEFSLEEVYSGPLPAPTKQSKKNMKPTDAVTVQVAGRLYDMEGTSLKNVVLTSNPVISTGNSLSQVLEGAGNAFELIAEIFIEPIPDFPLPRLNRGDTASSGTGLTAQPGTMQPGMSQPGMMQPGMMQPGMMQPSMMQPNRPLDTSKPYIAPAKPEPMVGPSDQAASDQAATDSTDSSGDQ